MSCLAVGPTKPPGTIAQRIYVYYMDTQSDRDFNQAK